MSAGIRSGVELNPLGRHAKHHAEGLHQPALAQAGNPHQQDVATRQQCDQGLIDDVALAEDDMANGGANLSDAGTKRLGRRENGIGVIEA